MSTNYHLWLAALLALLAPLGLLVTRSELQRYRAVVVEDLIAVAFKGQRGLPQIDLILSRYKARSRSPGQASRGQQDAVSPYMGAAFFWLISFLGFLILFTPSHLMMGDATTLHPSLQNSAFWITASTAKNTAPTAAESAAALKVVAVAGFGFLGGYIFQLGFLTRSALNLELGALSFVRASFRLLMGIIIAVIVYRGLGGAIECFPPMDGGPNPCTSTARVPIKGQGTEQVVAGFGAALGVAFFTGYWPEGAISALSKRLRIRLKLVSQTALDQAEVIPVEVIDGIDSEASFRLQESNIYDVQNLAAANPIELYAETPFGIFECFDWILQAQLCLVAGPGAFRALKDHNIRTIFDLERAVLAEGAPDDYVRAIGCIILRNTADEFRTKIGMSADAATKVEPQIIRHAVAIMGDDLHVHRLRTLWKALMDSTTGGGSMWLFEPEWLPGEPDRPLPPISADVEADVAQAAALGARYRAAAKAKADAETAAKSPAGGAAVTPASEEPAVGQKMGAAAGFRRMWNRRASATRPARTDDLATLRRDCLAAVTLAAGKGKGARARLRRMWDPKAPRKRLDEHSLEQFFADPDFVQVLG